jgi:hypothetical protein
LAQLHAGQRLIEICRMSEDDGVLGNTVGVLANMAHEDSIAEVVDSGAVQAVTRVFSVTNDPLSTVYAAVALHNLSTNSSAREQMVASGAIRILIEICRTSTDTDIVANVTGNIANLAVDSDIQIQLIRQGVLEALVKVCEACDHQKTLEHVAVAFAMLASSASGAAKMVEAGCSLVLTKLCEHGEVSSILTRNVCQAIVHMSGNRRTVLGTIMTRRWL